MVIHDGRLDRTTDARGPVGELTADALRRIRLRGANGETIPSLAQVSRLFRGTAMTFRVEIKTAPDGRPYPDVMRRVLAVLEAEGVISQTVIIAFHGGTAAAATREARLKGAVWLVEPGLKEALGLPALIAAGKSLGVTAIETHESAADADYVTAMREAGLGCGVWGANHEASIRRALSLGIDAFATDDPPLALQLRG